MNLSDELTNIMSCMSVKYCGCIIHKKEQGRWEYKGYIGTLDEVKEEIERRFALWATKIPKYD